MPVADSTIQFCSMTLQILFWKLQEATYCAYCMFVVRYSSRTIGSAKVRHYTYCKTMIADLNDVGLFRPVKAICLGITDVLARLVLSCASRLFGLQRMSLMVSCGNDSRITASGLSLSRSLVAMPKLLNVHLLMIDSGILICLIAKEATFSSLPTSAHTMQLPTGLAF